MSLRLILLLTLCSLPLAAQPWAGMPERDSVLFRSVLEIPERYINDHALVRSGGRWHLFYTTGRSVRSGPYWSAEGNEVEIGHATSPDLITWEVGPAALRIGPPGALDAGHIYAPTVIKRNGIWHMFYAGTPYPVQGPEHILVATSTDLNTWAKGTLGPVVRPDTS